MSTAFLEVLTKVRQTATAHASALEDALGGEGDHLHLEPLRRTHAAHASALETLGWSFERAAVVLS